MSPSEQRGAREIEEKNEKKGESRGPSWKCQGGFSFDPSERGGLYEKDEKTRREIDMQTSKADRELEPVLIGAKHPGEAPELNLERGNKRVNRGE